MKNNALTIQTVCQQELWAGFFGINENGDQPNCNHTITIKVEPECVEFNPDGSIRSVPTFRCPKCKSLLEWPQEWHLVTDQSVSAMDIVPSGHFPD